MKKDTAKNGIVNRLKRYVQKGNFYENAVKKSCCESINNHNKSPEMRHFGRSPTNIWAQKNGIPLECHFFKLCDEGLNC
jgi:hypothetical protein